MMRFGHLTDFVASRKPWVNRSDKRYARERELLGPATVAYDRWRDESAAVRIAYHRWAGSPSARKAIAFGAYSAALDREERAADRYARVIAGVGHAEKRTPITRPGRGKR